VRQELARHEAAAAMAPLVESPDETIVTAVLEALVAAGSERAVVGLVEALGHVEPERAERVHAVLVRLTGIEAPPTEEAWRAVLAD
jgi:hypothetical protein